MTQYPSDWRYTPTKGKVPFVYEWQKKPYTLTELITTNFALLSGPSSNGIMCIDFDGFDAIDYYKESFSDVIPDTVFWTSGKPGRGQMAFRVRKEYWPYLKTKTFGPDNHLEFRWGACSVIPPSIHPETNRPYYWIKSPEQIQVADLPNDVLHFWLEAIQAESTPMNNVPFNPSALESLSDTDAFRRANAVSSSNGATSSVNELTDLEVANALILIKSKYNRPGFILWRQIARAVAHSLGDITAATMTMKFVWPEEKPNEYWTYCYNGYNPEKSPKTGTLVWLAREVDKNFGLTDTELEQVIKQKLERKHYFARRNK